MVVGLAGTIDGTYNGVTTRWHLHGVTTYLEG